MTDQAASRDMGQGLPVSGTARFEGRVAFQAALHAAFDEAARVAVQQMWLVDPDFEDWPLGDRDTVDALARWALSNHGGHCTLMAASFDRLRAWPRWLDWRKTWSHRVTCLQVPDEWVPRLPSLLFIPGRVAVERLDRVHHRGSASREAAQWMACQERCDAISQRSTPTFPVTTLGL